jgi:hypothetical protein
LGRNVFCKPVMMRRIYSIHTRRHDRKGLTAAAQGSSMSRRINTMGKPADH